MKDTYNRIVLTVIAISLLWIAANGTMKAEAESGIIDVNIVQVGGVRVDSPYVKPIKVK
jgi:hypothetical protein